MSWLAFVSQRFKAEAILFRLRVSAGFAAWKVELNEVLVEDMVKTRRAVSQAAMEAQGGNPALEKTRLCKFFRNGRCRRGQASIVMAKWRLTLRIPKLQ